MGSDISLADTAEAATLVTPRFSEGLHPQEQQRTLEAFTRLSARPEAVSLLSLYSEVLGNADEAFSVINQSLSGLEGAELIPEVAKSNLARQANLFLDAADEILEKGSAAVSVFGLYETFRSVEAVEAQLGEINGDFLVIASLTPTFAEFTRTGIKFVDKYLFDTRPPEKPNFYDVRVLVYEDPDNPVMSTLIRQEGYPLGNEERGFQVEPLPTVSSRSIREAIRANAWEANQILGKDGDPPDIVVIPVSGPEFFQKNHYLLQQLFIDYWANIPAEKRPVVIMHTMGFEPQLYQKHEYEGFIWASDTDFLRNTLVQAWQLSRLKGKGEIFTPEGLSPLQQDQYDRSLDLREWEHKTADTYQSLSLILDRITTRDEYYRERSLSRIKDLFFFASDASHKRLVPQRPAKTILDVGAGDGRISGMLARLGFNVMALDISSEQLARGEQRFVEEGEGLRGEREHSDLSYPTLRRLQENGLALPVIRDDAEAKKHYVTVQGSFFELNRVLNVDVADWDKTHPGIDRSGFFDERWNEYAFADSHDMFLDTGFDYVLFNWHTLCEVGDPENLKDVLRQLLNVMNCGAELVIEIPDRTLEPYAGRLKEYHDKHPEEPFGVLREVYEGEEYSPRYFPGREEMLILLKAAGFEIEPEKDIQTYLIPNTGEEKIEVKELFITARKSKG